MNFNKAISHFSWYVSGHSVFNTTSDGSGYVATDIVNAGAVAVNASTTNWRYYNQASGLVVMLTDSTGTLVDGQFCLTVIEPVSDIFSY